MIRTLRTTYTIGLLGVCLPALVGCLPEDDLSDLKIEAPSPSISLPLLNTSLTVSDIITVDKKQGLLVENDDHTYSVLYRSQVQTDPVGDFFPKIPEQNYTQSFSLGINSPAFRGKSPRQKFQGMMELDLAGLNLFALESKQGFLHLTLTSDYRHTIEARVTFPNIRNKADDSPLVWNPSTIQYWEANITTEQIPLSAYAIELVDGKVSYELEVTIDGEGNAVNENEKLTLGIEMTDIEFAYLAGNFTDIVLPLKADTLNTPVLANAISGTVALNPTLRMNFKNSYGVKVASDFSNVFVEQKSGTVVRLHDEGKQTFFSGEYEFPFVTHRNDTSVEKSQVINRSTSNIEDAFAELPRGLMYDIGFVLDSSPEDTSFITDRSQIEVDVEVELPLEGSFDIVLQDSIPVNFRELDDVEELKVLIKTENSFPIEARLQVYFLDENEQLIEDASGQPIALFNGEDKFLIAATLDNTTTGKTTPATVDMPLVATINHEGFDQIRQATYLLVNVDLNSKSNDTDQIKLYSFYNIRFNLATQIKNSIDR